MEVGNDLLLAVYDVALKDVANFLSAQSDNQLQEVPTSKKTTYKKGDERIELDSFSWQDDFCALFGRERGTNDICHSNSIDINSRKRSGEADHNLLITDISYLLTTYNQPCSQNNAFSASRNDEMQAKEGTDPGQSTVLPTKPPQPVLVNSLEHKRAIGGPNMTINLFHVHEKNASQGAKRKAPIFDHSRKRCKDLVESISNPRNDTALFGGIYHECRKAANSKKIIELAFIFPEALSLQNVHLTTDRNIYDLTSNKVRRISCKETYSFPINLAIQYGAADGPTLQFLFKMVPPSVLAERDGPAGHTSLHVMLQFHSDDTPTLDAMIMQCPSLVWTCDQKGNTPLHTACSLGVCLESVLHLVIMYPEALFQRNFHGLTPSRLAQQCNTTTNCVERDDLMELLRRAEEVHVPHIVAP